MQLKQTAAEPPTGNTNVKRENSSFLNLKKPEETSGMPDAKLPHFDSSKVDENQKRIELSRIVPKPSRSVTKLNTSSSSVSHNFSQSDHELDISRSKKVTHTKV